MRCCSLLGSIAPCLSVPHPVPIGDVGGVLPLPVTQGHLHTALGHTKPSDFERTGRAAF